MQTPNLNHALRTLQLEVQEAIYLEEAGNRQLYAIIVTTTTFDSLAIRIDKIGLLNLEEIHSFTLQRSTEELQILSEAQLNTLRSRSHTPLLFIRDSQMAIVRRSAKEFAVEIFNYKLASAHSRAEFFRGMPYINMSELLAIIDPSQTEDREQLVKSIHTENLLLKNLTQVHSEEELHWSLDVLNQNTQWVTRSIEDLRQQLVEKVSRVEDVVTEEAAQVYISNSAIKFTESLIESMWPHLDALNQKALRGYYVLAVTQILINPTLENLQEMSLVELLPSLAARLTVSNEIEFKETRKLFAADLDGDFEETNVVLRNRRESLKEVYKLFCF